METPTGPHPAARAKAAVTAARQRPQDEFATRLRAALGQLSDEELQLLRWRFGLDAPLLEPDEIAERLGTSVPDVWDMEARALETLGFLLLTATTPQERGVAAAEAA